MNTFKKAHRLLLIGLLSVAHMGFLAASDAPPQERTTDADDDNVTDLKNTDTVQKVEVTVDDITVKVKKNATLKELKEAMDKKDKKLKGVKAINVKDGDKTKLVYFNDENKKKSLSDLGIKVGEKYKSVGLFGRNKIAFIIGGVSTVAIAGLGAAFLLMSGDKGEELA